MPIVPGHEGDRLASVRALLVEYEAAIGVDLCFQGFAAELASLPGSYAPPQGRLFLLEEDGAPAGCVALRSLGVGLAELKRLYVRSPHRGAGFGRALTEHALAAAREAGYERVRLDTLATMTEATRLYTSLGFREIEPYRADPIAGIRYFELRLIRDTPAS